MERLAVTVRGMVQGVGFRPFVFGLACRLHLRGFVKNRTGAVLIEIEGERPLLDRFLNELQSNPPPLAQIDDVSWQAQAPCGETRFRIDSSEASAVSQVFVAPDVAPCAECLAELMDPGERRYHYPFLNCTNCGPRLTIIQSAPYDRERTTMAAFPMCPACRAEYENPRDRRFHAQPTACPACGPRLQALDANGNAIDSDAPLDLFVRALQSGSIGAIKGLGGYHLACDARSEVTVAELRRRKQRDEKPFAIMVRDLAAAERLCRIDADERALLQSRSRPIVLLRRSGGGLAPSVAPGNPYLGVMLPYTPLHHLLMQEVDGPLVMTSGNRADEPIAYRDDDAVQRLGSIVDLFLSHDRPIHVRCDDSVMRIVDGEPQVVRRSRGYAPEPIKLPMPCGHPVLAVGGQLKGVFALGSGRHAFLSHHLGDLDHLDAYRAFERDIRLYQQLFDIRPREIVHDLHPDYASTRYARRMEQESGLPRLAVQHHHAHMASCMAEYGLTEPVIGVACDGTGYGVDGAIWGGEFLVGDCKQFCRAAHLRYVRLPGGDRAAREPWRMALVQRIDAGCTRANQGTYVTAQETRIVEQMIERGFNSPWTSSAGRLFDAVACLAGVRERVCYEGQAAMELEWLATEAIDDGVYPFEIARQTDAGEAPQADLRMLAAWRRAPHVDVVDTRPLIRAVVEDVERGTSTGVIARRFHTTLANVITTVCARIRAETGIDAVVLSGGVFMNALLTHDATARLTRSGFRVFRHRLVPPNDGGLSLGQIAVAAVCTT